MVITSLKLRLFARAELEVERPGSCGYLAKSSERQKSSISQKIVTISMQNSKGEGFGNQTVDLIYHIPNEFCFLFRRTHVRYKHAPDKVAEHLAIRGSFHQQGRPEAAMVQRRQHRQVLAIVLRHGTDHAHPARRAPVRARQC